MTGFLDWIAGWGAGEWTAVFTGATVIVALLALAHARTAAAFSAAPMIPEPGLSYGHSGESLWATVAVPREGFYSIAELRLKPRAHCMRAIVQSENQSPSGDHLLTEVGGWKAVQRFAPPQKLVRVAVKRFPTGTSMEVILVARKLPRQKVMLSLRTDVFD